MQVWTQRLRKHRIDGFREALQAIDDRDQDILDISILEVVGLSEILCSGLVEPHAILNRSSNRIAN
jgi:hypothetical protein